ncbi:glycoside hydrolase family 31 protein [Granulicella sp. WH15]|uniref:glycoside hydrolase family 31 protein n=1 Tax=Granulicella sp. WH15 TaxID=2602070 RepID=UPI00136793D8|nr:glycoside hydrolase family 31 protein [Granulicella sp. WH15]QHN02025.1 glycoside hydrolase family 31 protein [Granulicella sp. WH15]
MHPFSSKLLLTLALPLASLTATAQTNVAASPTAPRLEPTVPGFVRVNADSLALTVPGMKTPPKFEAGPLLLHDFDFNGEPVATSKLHLRQLSPGVVEITSVAPTIGYWRFRIHDGGNYYGLGERFDTLNHAHTVVRNAGLDQAGPKGATTYKPIPFFMSTTGYGLWLDTTAEATFDMNVAQQEEITIDATAGRLRVVLFTGPRFPEILEHFTALEGRAVLPPYWAFAPWKARDVHQNDADVLEDIDKTRALGLPASVILIDSPWASGYNSYKFNPKQFHDVPGMIQHLHSEGFKLVLWHTGWINNKSDVPKEAGFADKVDLLSSNYAEAASQGFFVKNPDGTPWVGRWWKGQGSLIDFTNPRAKQWWQDQLRQVIKQGADGFKDDDAEGSFVGGADQVRFADGTDQRLMRNKYAVLYNNAVEELVQKDLKGNGVLFARSATVGANGIGFLWGGDNEASFSPENGLPTAVTAGLGAGLSGMPLWSADLGGYLGIADTPNQQLLMRWTEYAAFSPVMEVMSTKNISPWNFDANAGGTKALDAYKRYSILHMSMFPYRYAAAQVSAKTGIPILRALVLDYQDDQHAREAKDEYLFGPDLLVAPVIDENVSRVVYLPEGEWIDFFTGAAVKGGQSIVANAPLDAIPVYARAGTILPKIPEDVMTLVPQSESGNSSVKTLDNRRVYELLGPAASKPTSITDFEGRTLVRTGDTLDIVGSAAARMIVRFRFQHPRSVTCNGAPVSIKNDANGPYIEFDHAGSSKITWQ